MTPRSWLATFLLGILDAIRDALRAFVDPWELIEREMAEQEAGWP